MESVARKAGHEPRLLEAWEQAHACPRCGHAVPCEGAAGMSVYDILLGSMKGAGPRMPSAHLAMARAGLSRKWEMSPATMTLVLPLGNVAGREKAPAPAAPQGAAGDDGDRQRAELVGTLARFIEYLKANGILADAGGPRGHHVLHMHAYIAKGLGMSLDYEFDFLEFGAFSDELELDLFRLGAAGDGAEPFGGDARASAAFLGLVRGRDARWLQAATFAMRERGRDGALGDFMAAPQGIIKHDPEVVRSAFGEVERAVRALAGPAP